MRHLHYCAIICLYRNLSWTLSRELNDLNIHSLLSSRSVRNNDVNISCARCKWITRYRGILKILTFVFLNKKLEIIIILVSCISFINISGRSLKISFISGMNISTRHRRMSGKKSCYVRKKLLRNEHSCPARSFFLTYLIFC